MNNSIPTEVVEKIVEFWGGRENPIVIEPELMIEWYVALPHHRRTYRHGDRRLYFGMLESGSYGVAYLSDFAPQCIWSWLPREAHQAMIRTYARHGAYVEDSGWEIVPATAEEEEHLQAISVFHGL